MIYNGGNTALTVEDADDAPPDTVGDGNKHGSPGRRDSRRDFSVFLGAYRITYGRVGADLGVLKPLAAPIANLAVRNLRWGIYGKM